MTKRYKLTINYHGKDFKGYQIQPRFRTVESELTKAVQTVFEDVKKVYGSGRTDTGVHAEGQVVHFDTQKIFESNIVRALNANLPSDIRVIESEEVESTFDARHSVKSREYNYLFSDDPIPQVLSDFVVPLRFQIKETNLDQFSEIIEGTHDFKRFRNEGSTENTTIKTVFHFSLTKHPFPNVYELESKGQYYRIRIIADGFLYRMVRNISGGIFEVLRGRQTISEFKAHLDEKETKFKYTTAPAKGLSLVRVKY